MIVVTRLNGEQFVINADLIQIVEERPDTTITLTTGKHIVVRESMNEIIALAVDYGRSLRTLLSPADPYNE